MKKGEYQEKTTMDDEDNPMMMDDEGNPMMDDPDTDEDNECDLEDDEMMMKEGQRFQKGEVEYRAVEMRASLIEPEEGQPVLKVLEGRAIVFDTPTPLFQDYDGTTYYEQIHHDALKGVDLSNVVLKYNHSEHVPPLASTKAGTLDLKADNKGLGIIARMANTTQASDIHELVRSGHLDKMSFAFTVANDAYDSKTKTRTIFSFDKIYDVSVVDFPAYEQTSVSARNYVKAQQEARRKELQRQERQAELERRQAEEEAEKARQRVAEEERKQKERQQLVLKTFV
jgi:HK97 family phage prohead protease